MLGLYTKKIDVISLLKCSFWLLLYPLWGEATTSQESPPSQSTSTASSPSSDAHSSSLEENRTNEKEALPSSNPEATTSQEDASDTQLGPMLKKGLLVSTESMLESIHYSFMTAGRVAYDELFGIGLYGWVKQIIKVVCQYALFQLLYYMIIEPKVLSKAIETGAFFDTVKLQEAFFFYAPYLLEFILKSVFFSLLLSWIKSYIEAMMGQRAEKKTTRERVYTTITRTLLIAFVIYDPLRYYASFDRLISPSLWYHQIYILVTLFFAMAAFVWGEFWICNSHPNDPLKNLVKGITKGFITGIITYIWFALLHTKLSDLDYVLQRMGIKLWHRNRNDDIGQRNQWMCTRLQEESEKAIEPAKKAAIFALFSWGGVCDQQPIQEEEIDYYVGKEAYDENDTEKVKERKMKALQKREEEKQNILDMISVEDGGLNLLMIWDFMSQLKKKQTIKKEEQQEDISSQPYSHKTLEVFSDIASKTWGACTAFYYNRLEHERSILRGLAINTLLAINPNF